MAGGGTLFLDEIGEMTPALQSKLLRFLEEKAFKRVEFKKRIRGLTPATTRLIDQYHWPGNIRELRNTIERAMQLATHEWLEPADFTGLAHPVTASPFRLPADGVKLEELERQFLMQALERTGGNQSRTAELLGLNRDQVRYRIEKFGLQLAWDSWVASTFRPPSQPGRP